VGDFIVTSAAVGTFQTASEAETAAVAERFAESLAPGDVVLLHGELGAGKTAFVRGMARGLGIPPTDVSSPTFTLIQEYLGPGGTLQHVDLYRLSPPEVDDLGLEELTASGAIVAIEWPDRWRDCPPAHEVWLSHGGDDRRRITIRPRS
jgi:tRNA threonylcarbamoyladenosine biosynthesis protein TsaE